MIHPVLTLAVKLQLQLNDVHFLAAKPTTGLAAFKVGKRCEVADALKPIVSWIAGQALGVADTFGIALIILFLAVLLFVARTRLGKGIFFSLLAVLFVGALLSVVPQLLSSFPGLANSC